METKATINRKKVTREKIISLMLLMVSTTLFSQHMLAQTGNVIIKIKHKNDLPRIIHQQNSPTIQLKSANSGLEEVFAKYSLFRFKQLYPDSRRPELLKYYILETDQPDALVNELKKHPNKFPRVIKEIPAKSLYMPNDYTFSYRDGLDGRRDITLSYLDLINAPQAWDLTKGDPNVVVGIYDSHLYTEHEDLQGKIFKVYDSNNRDLYTEEGADHGTMVAGLIASNTDNNKGIPAIGFNCMIAKTSFNKNDMIKMAKEGIKVINISQEWDDWKNRKEEYQDLIDELVEDYGVTVVAAAGNDDSYEYKYPASFDNVISVTSVGHEFEYGTTFNGQQFGWKDCHQRYLHSSRSVTSHQHNDKVDICAPGYYIITLCHPFKYKNFGSGLPTGQMYDLQQGSSFAAAIVSGVCALMYSVNPYLTPAEVEEIIKTTAADIYEIPENKPYLGMLGAGRIDAYEAVKRAINYKQPLEPIVDSVFEEIHNTINIFPNPTNGPLMITGTAFNDQVLFYSVADRLVKQTFTSSAREAFSVKELEPGMYIVNVIRNNRPIYQQKIVKM